MQGLRASLRFLLQPWARWAALALFVGSFFLPITGIGFDVCPLHRATGLPCPGCGVTRGLSLFSQGDFGAALGANPFVLLLWPVLALLAVLALMPQWRVDALDKKLDVLEPHFSRALVVLMFAFFGFGVLRLVTFAVLRERFP